MSNSAEKLVKQTIKLLSKTQDLDYEELKMDAKKLIRAARNFDETLLGMMEEIMDLGNVGAEEELEEFNPEVLKIYCRIKEIDDSGSDKSLRARVWNHIEEEFELSDDEEEEEDSEVSESEEELEPEPEPERVVKIKKSKKSKEPEVVVIN
uniref:Uncharacterized protein n=1 Tax=viral metagenome TaxID=1070528 RepID=A0A6C0AZ02_9ZZZZ